MNINNISFGFNMMSSEKSKSASTKKVQEVSDSLKETIVALAKEDAANAVYMGDQFRTLRMREVEKVAPNRAAAMAKATAIMNSENNAANLKKMEEADYKWIRMLLGLPYKAQFETGPLGTGTHIFDENGDEIATYTPQVGWQTRSSKAENTKSDELKFIYYDAYIEARQAIKNGAVSNTQKSAVIDTAIPENTSLDVTV
ncbi:hypothetical protein [Acetobacterium carbinolicum]|uniref:hypothetical protein n=1 Tax=Acetobacterium carbinolicum TaxID=52690 RepID=UPI0039C8D7BB